MKIDIVEFDSDSKRSAVAFVAIERAPTPIDSSTKNEICSELGLPSSARIEVFHEKGVGTAKDIYRVELPSKRSQSLKSTESLEIDHEPSVEDLIREIEQLKLVNKDLRSRLDSQLNVTETKRAEAATEISIKKTLSRKDTPIPNYSKKDHSSCIGEEIIDVPIIQIGSGKTMRFHELLQGKKAFIFDFWSTTCPNCPAAVQKLQTYAEKLSSDDILFFTINTDNVALAKSIIQEENWDQTEHYHVSFEDKEKLKVFLAMKTLPHHVALDEHHRVVFNGKNFEWNAVEGFLTERLSGGSTNVGSAGTPSVATEPVTEPDASQCDSASCSIDGGDIFKASSSSDSHSFIIDEDF